MKYSCVVLSVTNIHTSRKFYEDLFGLELYQDYGINIAFKEGISLQQDFDWLVNLPKKNPTTSNYALKKNTSTISSQTERVSGNLFGRCYPPQRGTAGDTIL